jgi:hypothetical protein
LPVLISDVRGQTEPQTAVLLDRSRGGLRLLGEQVYSMGTVLRIRSAKAEATDWLNIRVTHCLRSGPHWEVGCQFVRPPTAQQLRDLY